MPVPIGRDVQTGSRRWLCSGSRSTRIGSPARILPAASTTPMMPALRMRLPSSSRLRTAAIRPGWKSFSSLQGCRRPVTPTTAVPPMCSRAPRGAPNVRFLPCTALRSDRYLRRTDGFATIRALLMKSCASGLSVRFFRVMISTGPRGNCCLTGKALSSVRLGGNLNMEDGKIER